MRWSFVLLPAFALGAASSILHPVAGIIIGVFITAIGISCTEARPERGEVDNRAVIAAYKEKNKCR